MAFYAFPNGDLYETDSNAPANATKISGAEFKRRTAANARRDLLTLLSPGDTVTTVTVKSSRGVGASHHKLLTVAVNDAGKPYVRDITRLVAIANGHKLNDDTGGIIMSGWGYSRSFQLVYGLGCCLWPNGTPKPHGTRNGEPDTSGGYALKQRGL